MTEEVNCSVQFISRAAAQRPQFGAARFKFIVTAGKGVAGIYPLRAVNDNMCEHLNEKDTRLTKNVREELILARCQQSHGPARLKESLQLSGGVTEKQ